VGGRVHRAAGKRHLETFDRKKAADDRQAVVRTAITAGTHTPKRFGIKMNGDRQLRDISEDEFIEISFERGNPRSNPTERGCGMIQRRASK
jgi:hypothetical protein